MVPDEKPPETSVKSDQPAAKGPRRRSRRGGRRHSRRREPRPGEASPPPSSEDPNVSSKNPELSDELVADTKTAAQPKAPDHKQSSPRREPFVRSRHQEQHAAPQPAEPQPERVSLSESGPGPKTRSLTDAIEQVNQIIAELKQALEEMDDVLETLELAERQKINDEREIDSLQRALRRLNRPRDDQSHQ